MPPEPPEPAELQRSIGRQLATLRASAGVSQQQLANRTGYSRSSVAHAEAGRQNLTREFWVTADDRIGANGELLSAYDQMEAIRKKYARRAHEQAITAAYTELRALHSVPSREPLAFGEMSTRIVEQLRDPLTEILNEWVKAMNRRGAIRLLGGAIALPGVVLSCFDPDVLHRTAQAIASPKRVDASVIDHLSEMHRLIQAQDDALGALAVLDAALAQRDVVNGLLTGCPSPLRARLLTVSSGMSCSIGHYFAAIEDTDSALRCFRRAGSEAQAAGDMESKTYSLCARSEVAFIQGNPRASEDLARAALSSKGISSKVGALSCDVSARASSSLGKHSACMSYMDRALELLSSVSDVSSPAYHYNESTLYRHRSTCLVNLGKPDDAVTSALEGVRYLDPTNPDASAYTTLSLATAHLNARQIDESAHTLGNSATFAALNRTDGLVRQIHATRALLTPWNDTHSVKNLDGVIKSLGLSA